MRDSAPHVSAALAKAGFTAVLGSVGLLGTLFMLLYIWHLAVLAAR